ncbi:MAG TPA: cytochrome c biogenesis protein CcsA [Elusimicrobiota bacterium]|nr:cytochrome c biogenesis protein CcsA [Elusimicrobiota bacterium]
MKLSDPQLARLPVILAALVILILGLGFRPPAARRAFDVNAFGKLPVLSGGRIKPIDTVARSSLLELSGRQTMTIHGHSRSALEWLLDVLFRPEEAAGVLVFAIDNPDVLGDLGIRQTNQRRFSFAELAPHVGDIDRQAEQANQAGSGHRSSFQSAILNLDNQLTLYQRLQNTLGIAGMQNMAQALDGFEKRLTTQLAGFLKNPRGKAGDPLVQDIEHYRFVESVAYFLPVPPSAAWSRRSWTSFGTGILARIQQSAFHPAVRAYAAMADAWRAEDPIGFNDALQGYGTWLATNVPDDRARAASEFVFNYYDPFYRSMVIYLLVFLLVFFSWLAYPKTLNRAAFYLLLIGWIVHTGGLAARMILQGRPPVTNLYSSAVFVGWVAVLLGIILERLYRNGIGALVASTIGFLTLIIAQHLMASGDTLEMMRAVLDSNFWLATHVVCITVGYGSTFLSGFLAILYFVRERLDSRWREGDAATLDRMVYGIVCFATFFSFLGTILGGIWADQSWGRFWGWDPKENGALMIVLWNVFILHARAGRLAGRRATMLMAIFGNVVTAFSWFGVNMLGIGLHSYGFMEKTFVWLMVFAASQLAVMAWGYYGRPPNKIFDRKSKFS